MTRLGVDDDVMAPADAMEFVTQIFDAMEDEDLSAVEQILVLGLAFAVACKAVAMPHPEAHQNFDASLVMVDLWNEPDKPN